MWCKEGSLQIKAYILPSSVTVEARSHFSVSHSPSASTDLKGPCFGHVHPGDKALESACLDQRCQEWRGWNGVDLQRKYEKDDWMLKRQSCRCLFIAFITKYFNFLSPSLKSSPAYYICVSIHQVSTSHISIEHLLYTRSYTKSLGHSDE